tara:strand:- start:153 stop:422 length:270 start_codon:yes stop_codon:yes gene_type:complete
MAATRILPLAEKVSLTAGSNNATTVSNATVVRVLASSGPVVVVRTDSSNSIIGSFTMLANTSELVEKYPTDKLYVTGGNAEVAKVGFTG